MRARRPGGFTLVELLIVVAIIGILAAIAIPALLRARLSANEASVIGDIRTVVSAEAAYHSASGGAYGTLACLALPGGPGCIPNYPANGTPFLDLQTAAGAPKSGYARGFLPTPLVPGPGLSCYLYHAVPVNPGQTGVRAFAADCSGRICYTGDGSPVPDDGSELLDSCLTLK